MLVDNTMKSNADLLQNLCQVVTVDSLLDLSNAQVDVLTNSGAS